MSTEQGSLEDKKLGLERAKLVSENWAKYITLLSVLATASVSVYTLNHTAAENRKTRQNEIEMQRLNNRLDFTIAAANLLIESRDLIEMQTKAVAMRNLFEDFLPEQFDLNAPPDYLAELQDGRAKNNLMHLLVKHPDQSERIIELWKVLYPSERKWLVKLDQLSTQRQ